MSRLVYLKTFLSQLRKAIFTGEGKSDKTFTCNFMNSSRLGDESVCIRSRKLNSVWTGGLPWWIKLAWNSQSHSNQSLILSFVQLETMTWRLDFRLTHQNWIFQVICNYCCCHGNRNSPWHYAACLSCDFRFHFVSNLKLWVITFQSYVRSMHDVGKTGKTEFSHLMR